MQLQVAGADRLLVKSDPVLVQRPGADGRTRRQLLQEEYVESSRGGGPGQSNHGFKVHPWCAAFLPGKA